MRFRGLAAVVGVALVLSATGCDSHQDELDSLRSQVSDLQAQTTKLQLASRNLGAIVKEDSVEARTLRSCISDLAFAVDQFNGLVGGIANPGNVFAFGVYLRTKSCSEVLRPARVAALRKGVGESNQIAHRVKQANLSASVPSSSGGSSSEGATALCADGTYSYCQHPSGTCSWHGGVARWINYPNG